MNCFENDSDATQKLTMLSSVFLVLAEWIEQPEQTGMRLSAGWQKINWRICDKDKDPSEWIDKVFPMVKTHLLLTR